jgi:hypothetical protein
MSLAELQSWMVTVASVVQDLMVALASIIVATSTAIGLWFTLREYRLKLEAETRLAESAKAETDVRLLQTFTEMLFVASGRKGEAVYAKEILDLMVQKNMLTEDDFKSPDRLKEAISKATMLAQVPGEASALGALAAIAALTKKHKVLKEPAIAALENLSEWQPAKFGKYLDSIRENKVAIN